MLKHTNANLVLDHSYFGFTEINTDFMNETIELEPLHRILQRCRRQFLHVENTSQRKIIVQTLCKSTSLILLHTYTFIQDRNRTDQSHIKLSNENRKLRLTSLHFSQASINSPTMHHFFRRKIKQSQIFGYLRIFSSSQNVITITPEVLP